MSTFDPSKVIIQANAHDTLKNDDRNNSGSVTIPGSSSIAANGRLLVTQDVVVGSSAAITDIRFQTSRDTTRDYIAGAQLSFVRSGSLGAYTVYAGAFRLNNTSVQVYAFAVNPYGLTMTSQSGDETFTFKLRTYRAPF